MGETHLPVLAGWWWGEWPNLPHNLLYSEVIRLIVYLGGWRGRRVRKGGHFSYGGLVLSRIPPLEESEREEREREQLSSNP